MGGITLYAIGLMSGTSLDGIDAALCHIEGSGIDTKVELLAFETYPLSEVLRKKIRESCFVETCRIDQLCSLNFELGYAFSEAVSHLLDKTGFDRSKLDFIANHGQTIFHIPFAGEKLTASTLQLGESSIIAYEHQCQVIDNFRVMDMASGGQGAPLVPYSEFVLYSQKNKSIALLNIGGIGNVTWLDGSMDPSHVLAFDTGPGNMMINASMNHLYGKPYDDGGQIGKSGHLIKEMIEELKDHPYLQLEPPKSTGREMFGEDVVLRYLEKYKDYPKEDIVHTFTYFTAYCVSEACKKYLNPLDQLIVAGGGVHNQCLMDLLSSLLDGVEVLSQEDLGYNSDAKEAIAFVVMANETLHHQPSNMPSATGADRFVVLGKVTPIPFK